MDIFECRDFWGLFRTWGWLAGPVGPGVGFWRLGLGLIVTMLESRHRKWQGASVSDFWGVRGFVRPSVALRRGSGRTDWGWVGLGSLLGRGFRPLAALGVTERGRGVVRPSVDPSTRSPRSFDGLRMNGLEGWGAGCRRPLMVLELDAFENAEVGALGVG